MSSLELHQRRKVVIAYDNSEISQKVYKWAIEKILIPGRDHVVLVTVVTDDKNKWYDQKVLEAVDDEGSDDYIQRVRDIEERGEKILHDVAAEIRATGDITTQIAVVKNSDPKVGLINYTNNIHADLLITGSRGLGAIKGTLLGSVSAYAVHNSNVAVLVAKV